jgi:hypothetical protein
MGYARLPVAGQLAPSKEYPVAVGRLPVHPTKTRRRFDKFNPTDNIHR